MGVTARLASLAALLALVCAARADNSTDNSSVITFEPSSLLKKYEELQFSVQLTTALLEAASISVSSSAEDVATVQRSGFGLTRNGSLLTGTFNVTTVLLGYATVNVTLLDASGGVLASEPFEVTVLQSNSELASAFSTSLGVLVACMYIVMGATIDLDVVKRIIKKPIGPLLGLFCQYCCMPLIGFGMSQLVFTDPHLQLGMFIAGCSPGGGPSNVWTHLLGGTLDLSVTMTFTSTFAALGAIPAWVLLLGPVISEGSGFVIPFDRIALSLVLLIVPCSFGVFTQFYVKPLARFFRKILTPLALFNVLYISTFGVYANRYVFNIADLKTFLAALCLPFAGYTVGLSLALLLRQSKEHAIAISLETGIQNASVAMFLLSLSLPEPASLIAVVIPALTAVLLPLPLLCIYLIKLAVQKIRSRGRPDPEKPEGDAIDTISKNVPENSSEKFQEKPKLEGVDNPAADIKTS